MAKGYWMTAYREILDAEKLAAYVALAADAVQANGGRFLVRGGQIEPKEHAVAERTVLVEFDSYEAALTTYASPVKRPLDDETETLLWGWVRYFHACELRFDGL